jgi:hypothetical protein
MHSSDLTVHTYNGLSISILLYADDIVLIVENEINLQSKLCLIMCHSCYRWKLKLNIDKSNVVNFALEK